MWVAENSVIHFEGSKKSANSIDRAAQSIWVTEFSVTYMFCPASFLAFLTVLSSKFFLHLLLRVKIFEKFEVKLLKINE
jgi:hypothetical protein